MKLCGFLLLAVACLAGFSSVARLTSPTLRADWWFWPDYTLERNARNYV